MALRQDHAGVFTHVNGIDLLDAETRRLRAGKAQIVDADGKQGAFMFAKPG